MIEIRLFAAQHAKAHSTNRRILNWNRTRIIFTSIGNTSNERTNTKITNSIQQQHFHRFTTSSLFSIKQFTEVRNFLPSNFVNTIDI